MKRAYFLSVILLAVISLQAQKPANYTYKLENGIVVKTERTWSAVWVQQSQAEFKPGDDQHVVDVVLRPMGELIKQGTTVSKLTLAGKEVKMSSAAPGTYDLKVTIGLSGKPGTISFDAAGIIVKPKMKTTVTVTIHEYQILIDEAPSSNKGLAGYESRVIRYKGSTEVNLNRGIPSFYAKGAHDKPVAPDEKSGDFFGKIKPGTYDLLITIDISGKMQKVWLENFSMKADMTYKITTNLNSGEITYAGTNREVKQMLLYPAGTADKMQGAPKPDKSKELMVYEPAAGKFACRPGNFDVMLVIGNGTKYEWIKNIVVRTGMRADVK